jgi:aspartate/methionine/tyrosine aminotransferase
LLRAEGGWCAIIEVLQSFSEEDFILALLEQDNVLAHPGYFFDFQKEGYLVLSLLPPQEIFHAGCSRLLKRVKSACSA